MSPQSLERVLSDLAERADQHVVPDRLATVHRRARRAAARRTGAAVGTLAVAAVAVVLAVTSGRLSLLRLDGEPPANQHSVVITPRSPSLTVTLKQEPALAAAVPSRPDTTAVVVLVSIKGWVPQPVNAAGEPAQVATDNLLGLTMDWQDGGLDQTRAQFTCVPGGKLVEVDTSFPMTHYYARPGSYRVSYTTAGCTPVGEVVQTLTVTVKPAG